MIWVRLILLACFVVGTVSFKEKNFIRGCRIGVASTPMSFHHLNTNLCFTPTQILEQKRNILLQEKSVSLADASNGLTEFVRFVFLSYIAVSTVATVKYIVDRFILKTRT